MSKLLLNEAPLVVQPTLAVKLGLNEALVLQQIHYWATMKLNLKDGYYWVYNTYEDWGNQFPFMSKSTIGRVLRNLEKNKVIVVGNYNKLSFDKTKWYRIDYNELNKYESSASNDGFVEPVIDVPKCNNDDVNLVSSTTSERVNNTIDYTKTSTDIKPIVEPKATTIKPNDAIIKEVFDYLNKMTGKRFKASTQSNYSKVNARLNEGYTLSDIKYVIDNKCKQWLNTDMQNYLRPDTLFRVSNFESYINEPPYVPKQKSISNMQAAANIMQLAQDEERRITNEQKRYIESNGDDKGLLPW